ncbi:hypothetical protein C1645_824691 [Glomus cerebriforme]|uniref:Protein kinase domain-containing protein n=1 Tax=Glomus cerebriforme TaxID=658196 RepID=A0A397SX36_9GLOM|nr:hypothetical protein C1645_824691 [Glomus cerebriforme]
MQFRQHHALQLLNLLKYIHDERVFYQDVCLSNILLDTNDNIILADWGSAIHEPPDEPVPYEGTVSFALPDILNSNLGSYRSKASDDLHSFTVIEYWNDKLDGELWTEMVNGKINTELNSKLSAEIEKFKARDDDFNRKAQKILNNITTKVNNIKEACRNEFGRISSEFNASIEALQNEMIQRYVFAQRLQIEFDQVGGDSLDYMFETVRCKICDLTGKKIEKSTVKSFYYGEGSPKYDVVMLIMRWVVSKEISDSLDNNNASSANNNAE